MTERNLKYWLARPVVWLERWLSGAFMLARQLHSYARLQGKLSVPLPTSTVVMGHVWVFGSGRIHCGENLLLYPEVHLETQNDATIILGDRVVVSRGVHLVAMEGITIGAGAMIGEYASIRDSNHSRREGVPMRDAGHLAHRITIGSEVWIGRGAAILDGVTIGNGATVGANAVVTHDVPAGETVVGVPARILSRRPDSAPAEPPNV
jgi:acetyltransferase-like isoleucine patch superfamily enzyme